MFVGMFTVFAFLTLLVGLMKMSAAFFEANAHRFSEEESTETRPDRSNNEEEIAVAIAVAEAMRRGQRV
jgi:Na+-transporting methylmalonyl-CoA/oxaloacetate decarboxylase gamma subunit